MNKATTISTLFVVTLIVIVGNAYRSASVTSVDTTDAGEFAIDNGMPSNEMSPRDVPNFDELIGLINKTISPDEWTGTGSPTRIVKTNQLIETERTESDHVLTLDLHRGDTLLATQTRYLKTHRGPDMEVVDFGLPECLACAMYASGFLSGSFEILGESDDSIALRLDWMFDDKSTGLETNFRCSFDATVDNSGIVNCGNGAKVHWKLERNAIEHTDEPKSQ
jgi:hypothetical protein